jgi:hypothetical protein
VYIGTLVSQGQAGVVERNVLALAQGPNGQVWMDLNQPAPGDVGLYLFNPTTSSYSGYSLVEGLAEGNDGNAYYLQNSTVYNGTLVSQGQAGVVERNVLALAQGPNGQVWMDLNQPAGGDQGLYLFNPTASSYSGYGLVQGLAEGNDGNAYYLQNNTVYNGTLVSQGQAGVVERNVLALAQGPNGQVWMDLNQPAGGDQGLYLFNPVASSYSGYGLVQGLAEGNDGNAYYLQKGSLYNATTGADVHDNVLGIAQGPNGQILVNLGADGLRLWNSVAANWPSYGVAQGLAEGNAGNAYYLQNGTVYNATTGTTLASNIQALAGAGDGAVFVLASSGVLQQLGTDGQLHQVGFDLSLFTKLAADPNGTVYAQDSGGILYQYTPLVGWSSQSHVSSFAIGGDGKVYYLQTNGSSTGALYQLGALNAIATGVVSFAVGGDGKVYYLAVPPSLMSLPAGVVVTIPATMYRLDASGINSQTAVNVGQITVGGGTLNGLMQAATGVNSTASSAMSQITGTPASINTALNKIIQVVETIDKVVETVDTVSTVVEIVLDVVSAC